MMNETDVLRGTIQNFRYFATRTDIWTNKVQEQLLLAADMIEEANSFFFDGHGAPIVEGNTLLEKIQALASDYEEQLDNMEESMVDEMKEQHSRFGGE